MESASILFSLNGSSPDKKRKLMIAGRDYEHDDVCLICWDGGNLIVVTNALHLFSCELPEVQGMQQKF